MEVRATHTELEENWHDRAEGAKHYVDGMQVNGKQQDEVESASGRPMFHLGTIQYNFIRYPLPGSST